ncbi:MAG: 2,3,4,5-tetrahydropyridine-2,6-dicarboxylate N-succinyltransferase [Pseudomonadales bacterium]|nr:MAG: 2,3,4,5-tetrahydropyridine-2,6-dicarboxylate N-succinyltransferase [Pseudomonadales bacterium]
MSSMYAFALGLATVGQNGEVIEAWYPEPSVDIDAKSGDAIVSALAAAGVDCGNANTSCKLDAAALTSLAASNCSLAATARAMQGSKRQPIAVILHNDSKPGSVAEAYLKLQLISHRLKRPHEQNLDGIFACLPNLAWTSEGPVEIDALPARQLEARAEGRWLKVNSVDKFPPMTDYVVPDGVRIAHTARVRLGAYIGAGTTIMHEGFVNFNAGTLGTSMVEGRISAGVVVGEGSDLGGGSSTMGTLSGGGNVVIAVGENCLLGANAGVGIGLGDRCIVEAGLYVTAGTKVALLDDAGQLVREVKARELSGQSDLLFRRNSSTGAVECKTNRSKVALNEALHANN